MLDAGKCIGHLRCRAAGRRRVCPERRLLLLGAGRLFLRTDALPQVVTLISVSGRGEVTTVSFAGLDLQPPGFTSIDSANAFVLSSRRLGQAAGAEPSWLRRSESWSARI